MRIKIAGLEYSALLDSGGGLSIIGGKIGERLRALGFKFVPSGKEVTLTQGTVILPFAVTLNFAWMGGSKGHTFYILPDDSEQIILGNDFLFETGIDISMSRGGWFKASKPENITPFDTWAASGEACHRISVQQQWVDDVCQHIKGPEATEKDIKSVMDSFAEDGFFSKKPGTVHGVEHTINTGNEYPRRDKVRPMNAHKTRILDEQIKKILEDDIIEECESPWRCNPVLVAKKGEKRAPNYRLCIDYRSLNEKTKHIPHAMPRIDWILAQLGRAKVFTTIDLSQGYHQIKMSEADKKYVAQMLFIHPGVHTDTSVCLSDL
jgi:hypothetical protein